jgi:hypothetical protein
LPGVVCIIRGVKSALGSNASKSEMIPVGWNAGRRHP